MGQNNQSFSEDLDRLINLFRKIKEKMNEQQYHNLDKSFIQNIDLMINNYETIKGNVPQDMLNTMGEPIHKMMTLLIDQISAEYGDILGAEIKTYRENKPEQEILPHVEIAHIDEMLKRGDIKPEEVDKLLDLRAELKAKEIKSINEINPPQ